MTHQSTKVPVELLKKYDRPGPRYTSYPTAPVWKDNVGSNTYEEALKASSLRSAEPLAIYCHIPFCECRCYYCGCNTYITKNSGKVSRYIELLAKEIDKTADLLEKRNKISQLHFGGGTPTYLNVEQIKYILDKLDSRFEYTVDCEKSLEIDPRVTSDAQLDFLSERGFNRISLGVQDFDEEVQQAIGRVQSYELVKNKIDYCRNLNFEGINIDLIYGLPKQTLESFRTTIKKTIELHPDRVALYSFAFLPTVKANQMKINPDDLPNTELKFALFAHAVEIFTEAGYLQIGMDHFALPEDELSVAQIDGRLHRNFMGYTVKTSPEMIGLGMSSIGYIDNGFYQNYSKLDSYMDALESDKFSVFRGLRLNDDDLMRQYVISQLMCNFRLSFDDFYQRFKINYTDYFQLEHKQLADFFEDNFLEAPNSGLTITPLGRTFIRNIAMTFDAYLGSEGPGKKPTFSRTI